MSVHTVTATSIHNCSYRYLQKNVVPFFFPMAQSWPSICAAAATPYSSPRGCVSSCLPPCTGSVPETETAAEIQVQEMECLLILISLVCLAACTS